jgi:hypothetical protein
VTPPIHDITAPGEFLPGPPPLWHSWWFWPAVLLGIALLGLLPYYSLRKKTAAPDPRSLLEQARQELESLRSEAGNLPAQAIAVRISLIIRRYLEAAFDDPALFETNEEFILRDHALEKLHPECRAPMVRHLKELSGLKYSLSVTGGENTGPVSGLIDQAAGLLSRVEQSLSAPEPSPTA